MSVEARSDILKERDCAGVCWRGVKGIFAVLHKTLVRSVRPTLQAKH